MLTLRIDRGSAQYHANEKIEVRHILTEKMLRFEWNNNHYFKNAHQHDTHVQSFPALRAVKIYFL